MAGARLLLADDEASIRESLRMILEFEGYRVEEVSDGMEALDHLTQKTPDAVLPDVIRGVQERSGEAEYPDEIAPSAWYPGGDEPPPAG